MVKGCVRTYYISKNGVEKTRRIACENDIVTVLPSFISKTPSTEILETLEYTILLLIGHDNIFSLNDRYPEWQSYYLKAIEDAFLFQHKKIETLVTF